MLVVVDDTALSRVRVTLLSRMDGIPLRVTAVPPTFTVKAAFAGVLVSSRFALNAIVSESPLTHALETISTVLLVTAWSVKVATSVLPVAEARSGLVAGLV